MLSFILRRVRSVEPKQVKLGDANALIKSSKFAIYSLFGFFLLKDFIITEKNVLSFFSRRVQSAAIVRREPIFL